MQEYSNPEYLFLQSPNPIDHWTNCHSNTGLQRDSRTEILLWVGSEDEVQTRVIAKLHRQFVQNTE